MVENKKAVHLMGLAMLLGLFVPHTSTFLLIINPLLCVVLFFVFKEEHNHTAKSFGPVKLFLCGIIVISTLHSVVSIQHGSNKYLLSSIMWWLLLLLFPFAGNNNIPKGYYFVAVYFIILTQVIYLLNVPSLQHLMETIYPAVGESTITVYERMTRNITTTNIFNYRLGGLYYNPNQCSRYVCLITAAYLAERNNAPLKKVSLFILSAFVSVLLTGSRTGLVVIFLIITFFTYRNSSVKKEAKVALSVAFLVIILPLFIFGSNDYRGFNVSQGLNNSANKKWYVIADYLSQDNTVFHLLFGYGDIENFQPSSIWIMENFDSEYGNVIYCYGFLGFFMLVLFYINAIKACPQRCRFFFFILLWSITSTIMMSYRMSFVFMLFLSHIVTLKQDYSLRYE